MSNAKSKMFANLLSKIQVCEKLRGGYHQTTAAQGKKVRMSLDMKETLTLSLS